MSPTNGNLNYRLCGFPGSRIEFRGPVPDMSEPFVAMLGGTETFGKYVGAPFPSLFAEWARMPVMNLGVCHSGLSLLDSEKWLLDAASRADLTVLQVPGAQTVSNRLYCVHPRRNDRFIGASPRLCRMFPDVDFAEINFTGHLMETLARRSPEAFSKVIDELRQAWMHRMRKVIDSIRGDVLLLWMSDRHPEARGGEPLFVNRDMLDRLTPYTVGMVEAVFPEEPSLEGKIVPFGEEQAALKLPGPVQHARIAEALVDRISRLGLVPGHAQDAARATGS